MITVVCNFHSLELENKEKTIAGMDVKCSIPFAICVVAAIYRQQAEIVCKEEKDMTNLEITRAAFSPNDMPS